MSEPLNQYVFRKKSQLTLCVVLIVLLTGASYWKALDNGFTNWDDDKYVTKSIVIKDLSWKNIKDMFTRFYVSNYHPVTLLSYAVEYRFSNLAPHVYHVTNLVLHLFNSLLVFWLILFLSNKISISLVAALLFGIHPLHVESVAWISERKDVLSTFFFLGALISYCFYQKKGAWKYYSLSIVAFILSLLSKPMAVSLPFVLVLCDYLSHRKLSRKTLIEKIPFLAITAAFVVIVLFAQRGAVRHEHSLTFFHNVLIACHGIVFYLSKTVAPVRLSCLYPYPPGSGLPLVFWLSPILVAVLAALVILSRKYTRTLVFGSLFFFITILPVLQLVPVGHAIAADRYMYIPSIGLFYLAGVAFHSAHARKTPLHRVKNTALIFLLAIVMGTLSVLTWQRTKVWEDGVTLWSNVLTSYPNTAMAHGNLGIAYAEKGLHGQAMTSFKKALEIDPNNAGIHNNLGLAYERRNRRDEAMLHYKKALEIDPRSVAALCNLGNAYSEKGRHDEAIVEFKKALEIDPYDLKVHNSLGLVYGKKDLYEKAVFHFEKALEIDPQSADAYANLGNACSNKGSSDQAFLYFKKALEIDPQSVKALNSRGITYGKKGLYDAAILEFKKALEIDPNDQKAHNNLGVAYGKKGSLDRAVFHFKKVLEIDPKDQRARKNLEVIYRKKESAR